MEDWAEIRRLHRAEGLPIKAIVRTTGFSRNTVRAALRCDEPPKYQRVSKGSLVDAVEPQVRQQLALDPKMPATVIAERIEWTHSLTILKDRLRQIRPEYVGIDPADRIVRRPGESAQMDLWFPAARIPTGYGNAEVLPVLVMTLTFSKFLSAMMIPSRQAGDILAGMWALIGAVGRVSKTLVWDRESAIGGTGKVTEPARMFAGTLGTRIVLAPPRDPEFKGMTERNNGYLETSFLPGREFASPADFNDQLGLWLPKANARTVRSLHGRPIDFLDEDLAAMTVLPPVPPQVGLTSRVRLSRDYYVRVDGNDYSAHPSAIGRFVDVAASMDEVVISCQGQVIGAHQRCWDSARTITDDEHVAAAKILRRDYATAQKARHDAARRGKLLPVEPGLIRDTASYDEIFGVDFDPNPTDGRGEVIAS